MGCATACPQLVHGKSIAIPGLSIAIPGLPIACPQLAHSKCGQLWAKMLSIVVHSLPMPQQILRQRQSYQIVSRPLDRLYQIVADYQQILSRFISDSDQFLLNRMWIFVVVRVEGGVAGGVAMLVKRISQIFFSLVDFRVEQRRAVYWSGGQMEQQIMAADLLVRAMSSRKLSDHDGQICSRLWTWQSDGQTREQIPQQIGCNNMKQRSQHQCRGIDAHGVDAVAVEIFCWFFGFHQKFVPNYQRLCWYTAGVLLVIQPPA